jgi:hypothetical protein
MKYLILLLALVSIAQLCKSQELDSLTIKNRIAFIQCDTSDLSEAYTEATKEFTKWNHWKISQDSTKADFILEIKVKRYPGMMGPIIETQAIIKNKKNQQLWKSGRITEGKGLRSESNAIGYAIRQLITLSLKDKFKK